MELLKTVDAASVMLFDTRLSEGEIQTFATALAYMLDTLDNAHLHAVFNEDVEPELETPAETRQFLGSLGFRMMLAVDNSPRPTYGDCCPL